MSVRCVVLLGIGHTNAHILKEWTQVPIPDCRLVCISRFPTLTYSGMLPGTLAVQFSPDEMQIDLKQLVTRARATLILADVTSVDWTQRMLHFAGAESLKFDILSVGVGSIPAGIPETNAACLVAIKPMQTFLQRLDKCLDVVNSEDRRDAEGRSCRRRRGEYRDCVVSAIETSLSSPPCQYQISYIDIG